MKFFRNLILIFFVLVSQVGFAQNNVLYFDGIDDYVNLNSLQPDVYANRNNFTVEFWMKADKDLQSSSIRTVMFVINEPTGENRLLITLGGDFAMDGYLMIYPDGAVPTNTVYNSHIMIGDDLCHHIAYAYDGATGYMFIDGILVGTYSVTHNITINDRYSLGQDWDNLFTSQFYNGTLDEVRIWSTVKTQVEIQAQMYNQLTGSEPNLIAYYNFNQGIANANNAGVNTLVDLAPGAHNGPLLDFALNGTTSNWTTMGEPHLGNDTLICSGTPLTLDAGIFNSYLWSTGAVTSTIVAGDTGMYSVVVMNGSGCVAMDSVHIAFGISGSFLPNDTIACSINPILIDVPGFASYLWNDGSTNPFLMVDSSGIFYVDVVTIDGCTGSDTIEVQFADPIDLDLGADTLICPGNPVILSPNGSFDTYDWSTGATTNQIQVNTTGTYSLTVTLDGCEASDSIEVDVTNIPVFQFGEDLNCLGDSGLIVANYIADSYLWNTGATTSEIYVYASGYYSLIVENQNCEYEDSIYVNQDTNGEFDLGPDTAICSGEPIQLNIDFPFQNILWSTGSTGESISVNQAGTYSAIVSSCGITWIDSMVVSIQSNFSGFYIPNTFTPNMDELNEKFFVKAQPDGITFYRLIIFDRWGEEIFSSTTFGQGWDGTYKNKLCPNGIYAYRIEVNSDCGNMQEEWGRIQILR